MKGKYKIMMLWLGLLLGVTQAAAAIVTTAGTGSVCPENEVVIPITVSNCDGVTAISLALNFDNTKIAYQGFQNVNSQVASMLVNQSNGRIYITWANLNAVNLGNATLLELRFTGISGTSSLTWQTNQCEYSNAVGSVIQSTYTNGSVTVYGVPNITSNPVDRNIAEGQNTYFEVSATGQGLSYQWQLKAATSNEWQNLSNGGNYSNVTTRRLNVNNVTMDMNGNQYRCIVSGTCLPPVTSEAASLSVQVFVPTIVTTISSVVACADQVFSVPVIVTNCNNVGAISLALNYNQSLMVYVGYENANTGLSNGSMRVNADNGVVYFTWVSSNQTLEIGNGELISLVFKSASGNSSLTWNTSLCEYSNRYGATIPSSYTGGNLNVYFPPSISANPTDKTVMEGSNTSFSITASGDGLSYQWQMSQDEGISWETLSNGGHYSNVTNRTLNVNNVVASMDGYRFRCQVSGSCESSVTSNYATLHVNTFIPTIVTTAGSLNTCSEIEFGIPVTVTNCNNVGAISLALSYNTDVLTYTGYEGLNPELAGGFLQVNASNGMVFIAWASSPGSSANVGNANLITLRFSALSGTSSMNWHTAYCEYANATGVTIPSSYNNGSVTVGDLSFTITNQPTNQTIVMEESTTFTIATEGPTTGFQWQVSQDGGASWSNISTGGHYATPTTNTLAVNNVTLDMNGYCYRCVVSGSCGVQYSSSALLTVNLPPNYYEVTLAAEPEAGGTTEGAGPYLENTSCTVTAAPATGYDFVNWTENGNEVSQEPSYTFAVTGHRDLVAHFTLQEITINVSANPIGGGTLNGGGTYLYGDHVLLTAIPITGSVFDNWTEDGVVISTNQSISFTAQTDRTLVANFSVQQVNIIATPVPANNGTIEGTGTYAYGSMVTLVAHAGQGFEFSNWTENGEVISTNDTLSFVAENDRSFEAHFITRTLNITATVEPEVGGTVAGAGVYNYGDPVALTAIPQGMFEFLNWTENGVEVSTQPIYTFTAYNDRNLVAHFFTTITIAATVQPEGSGTISGEGTYNYADPVTLTALPNTGYSFVNWTENDTVFSTTTSINFTAYANRNFVAHFDPIMHHVTVSANMEAGGTVTGEGDYQEGGQATVSAYPNAGYEFVSWQENGVTVSAYQNYTFTVWEPRNLVAEFSLIRYTITATSNPSEGGSVTGTGTFLEGETCTLTAIPSEGYSFENWSKQGDIVSDSTVYSFAVTEDAAFVANFAELPVLDTTLYAEICDGENYLQNGFEIYWPSVGIHEYSITLQSVMGYDSIVNLALTVYPVYFFTEDTTLCNMSSFTWRGHTYTESGFYYDSLQTVHGCDSIYQLSLDLFNTPLGEFTYMTPTNNYPFTTLPITFSWDAVSGAEYYNLYLWNANEPVPSEPIASNIHNRSYYVSSLQNHQTYNWYVEAVNTCFTTTSNVRNFSLNIPPTMSVSTSNLAFSEVVLNDSVSLNMYVSGNALDDVITMQITGEDAAMFSFEQSTNWNEFTGGLLSVTFSPTAVKYNYTANLVITSGTISQTVHLTGSLADMFVFNTYVTQDIFQMNSIIPIYGTVMDVLGNPVPSAEVEVKVTIMNTTRSLFATTGADGHFMVNFEPAYSESGYYTINSGRVGHNSTAVHDDFNIPGMNLVTNNTIYWDVTQNDTINLFLVVKNRSQIPLTNIQVASTSLPDGCTFSFHPLSLDGMEEGVLEYSVCGSTITNGNNYEQVNLVATSSEGAVMSFRAWYYCEEPRGLLFVNPENITTSMTKGQDKTVDVMLYNNGTGPTGSILINLPSEEWLSLVGNDSLSSIAVHDSAYFSLRLSAKDNTPLVQYTGNIAINCERGDGVSLPYCITAVSDSTGMLVVDVTDDYTYNGNGQHFAGATVTVVDYYTLEVVAMGLTDDNGLYTVEDIQEGYYRMSITAPHHAEYQATIQIEGGQTNTQDVYLQYQAITYSWNVIPTEIQDEYSLELIVEFETNVPVPVITIEMPKSFPELEEGESFVFYYIVTNHGLVSSFDATLYPPSNHPLYEFTALITEIDTLYAQSSVVIPCTMTRRVSQRSQRIVEILNGNRNEEEECPYLAETQLESYYICRGEMIPIIEYCYVNIGSIPCYVPVWHEPEWHEHKPHHYEIIPRQHHPPVTIKRQGCSDDSCPPDALDELNNCPPKNNGTPKLPPTPGSRRNN